MEEKDRYVYKTIDGYNFIVDTKTDERYFINKFLVGFFNRQDREINRLTKMLYTTVKHTDKLNEENNKQKNKWEFDYKDLTGKRKTKGGFATKVEAEKAQAKMIDELNKGLFVANYKLTFREAAELYLDNYAKIYCKKSTWIGYEGYLKHHIYEYLGD